ncbi:hypothetical protein PG994_001067 [Apiospora phragmitis]|uniref:RING-type domain-containing protein n=1 Tax=Apiospora phragmitis TaxID=2905665 RepID=A0ABR1WSG8_9PEZI
MSSSNAPGPGSGQDNPPGGQMAEEDYHHPTGGPEKLYHLRLFAECEICQDNKLDTGKSASGLPLEGTEAASIHEYNKRMRAHTFERTDLLPCGHLLGYDRWQQQLFNRDKCPKCRRDVRCAKCYQPLAMPCVKREGLEVTDLRGDAPQPASPDAAGNPKPAAVRDVKLGVATRESARK